MSEINDKVVGRCLCFKRLILSSGNLYGRRNFRLAIVLDTAAMEEGPECIPKGLVNCGWLPFLLDADDDYRGMSRVYYIKMSKSTRNNGTIPTYGC